MTTALPYTEWLQCRDAVAAELERQDPGVNGQKLAGDLLAAGYIDTARILGNDDRPPGETFTDGREWTKVNHVSWGLICQALQGGDWVRVDTGHGTHEARVLSVSRSRHEVNAIFLGETTSREVSPGTIIAYSKVPLPSYKAER